MLPVNQAQTPAKLSRPVTDMEGQSSGILSFREPDKIRGSTTSDYRFLLSN